MSRGVLESDESRVQPGDLDTDEFARSVRRFALEARDVLGRPNSTLGELIGLRGCVLRLLQQAAGMRSPGIVPWLLAVQQRIDVRLEARSVEDLDSLVA
jgi:hypothetical protein